MGTWRCPHCGTLQAESARCFLCGRSATSCATCVNFRASLVGGLGYCALDRRREPLSGAEQRDCWTGTPADGAAAPAATGGTLIGLMDAPEHRTAEVRPSRGALRPISGQ